MAEPSAAGATWRIDTRRRARARRWRLAALAGVVVLGAAVVPACSSGTSALPPSSTTPGTGATSGGAGAGTDAGAVPGTVGGSPVGAADDGGRGMAVLYVQQAGSGSLTRRPGDGRDFTLQLDATAPTTTWFSDRPVRRAGTVATAAFVADWRGAGFVDDPPNAALVTRDAAGAERTVIVELTDPVHDRAGGVLRYRVRILDRPNERLEFAQAASPATSGAVEGTFGSASLFIDDADVSASVSATGTLTAAAPSTTTTTAPAPAATTPGTTSGSGAGTTIGLCSFAGPVPEPTVSATGAPVVSTQAAAPLGPASSSPTLAEAYTQFNELDCTHYQHSYTETPPSLYYYDCVGFTSYTVRRATPQAWASVVEATGIGTGYVPTPAQYQQFFAGLPTSPATGWTAIPTATAIAPGAVLAWGPEDNNPSEAGHSVLALSTPVPLGDGTFALVVMDSTATDHGPDDTRHADNPLSQRNAALGTSGDTGAPGAAPATAPSGLGIGTIGLVTDATGAVTSILWSLGTTPEPVAFGAGQPVS